MTRVIAFDLDGTLAQSKQPLSPQMGSLLARLLEKMPVAVMSGAGLPQYKEQFLQYLPNTTRLENLYLFPDSAAQCFVYKTGDSVGDWQVVYDQSFSESEKKEVFDALESALKDPEVGLWEAPAQTWGERIEDRGAEIAFSPLGQHAPVQEKQAWHDAHEAARQKLREILSHKLPAFAVTTGGITTVDITRLGVTKAYGVQQLSKLTNIPIADMLYVGDALGPGGNDAVVVATGVPTHAVAGPDDTAVLIKEILGGNITNMNTSTGYMKWILGVVFVVLVVAAGFLAFWHKTQAPVVTTHPVNPTLPHPPAMLADLITVDSPLPYSTVGPTSVAISGRARGNWYFEATAPVELKNASGTVIASGHITAQGDWMTTEYVPFAATLSFPAQPAGSVGTLVLQNDNPSGDPTKQKELDISVYF